MAVINVVELINALESLPKRCHIKGRICTLWLWFRVAVLSKRLRLYGNGRSGMVSGLLLRVVTFSIIKVIDNGINIGRDVRKLRGLGCRLAILGSERETVGLRLLFDGFGWGLIGEEAGLGDLHASRGILAGGVRGVIEQSTAGVILARKTASRLRFNGSGNALKQTKDASSSLARRLVRGLIRRRIRVGRVYT